MTRHVTSAPERVRHRGALTTLTATVAVWAYAGAVGIIGGGIDFGPTIEGRLPWQSTTLAGVALLLGVAGPMTAAAVALWRQAPYATRTAVIAGVMLVGWILVQLAFIRTFSWLQPVCVVLGLAVVGLAVRAATP
ncbi:hypothetical protein [Actinokineospora xionganensis]|uniref:Major facilitator superfamily (MFS) profile domain-containing protein n=1 Tax=Actinokineospora xionganensis TaxID=2684470 RepID=A0ABR7LAL8_9PSEU|nr:hypothetical protein [Actinokineospora xionganensis]MBC6449347.1 hypothetical protein [Actinokineospora xionganensis]